MLEAGSGVEALQLWDAHDATIDLLLTDLVMPGGVDGRSLAAQLLAKDPKLRVVFSSGYSNDLGSEGFELVEGVSFLPKPYTAKSLRVVLHDQLARVAPAPRLQ